MSRRYKTTINRLRRTVELTRAKRNGESWWVNPKEHPLPTLPDRTYLLGEYLIQLAKSCPHLVNEAIWLLRYLDESEEGRVKMEGRRKGVER